MTYLKIHCTACGESWRVFEYNNFHADGARRCPNCSASIDGQTWERQVIPALGATADANRELQKDHTGNHTPLFTFDVITGPRQEEASPANMDQINADLTGLRAEMEKLNKRLHDVTEFMVTMLAEKGIKKAEKLKKKEPAARQQQRSDTGNVIKAHWTDKRVQPVTMAEAEQLCKSPQAGQIVGFTCGDAETEKHLNNLLDAESERN